MKTQAGSSNNGAKITEATAAKVKGLNLLGVKQTLIASTLGVTRANVWAILHGLSWSSIDPDASVTIPVIEPRTSKVCPICRISKVKSEFVANNRAGDGFGSYCKACNRACNSRALKELRLKVLQALGGKCVCCEEDTFEFLAIDHIDNDGAKCRALNHIGRGTYRKILAGTYTSRVQVLCHNCNCAKGFYGICPHKNAPIT